MNQLRQALINTTAARHSRQRTADLIISEPDQFEALLHYSFSMDELISHRACWVLEFVCHRRLEWVLPEMDLLIMGIQAMTSCEKQCESCLRPLAKIYELVSEKYAQNDANFVDQITPEHTRIIVEHCFDWLIGNHKVATKAYAMQTLFHLRNTQPWISDQLKQILLAQRKEHSAAYQARSKNILLKLSKENFSN